jgi:SEC-C motif domain protein
MNPTACPCGSATALADCCGRLHGGAPAADAEQLMRSRYSAYVLGDEAYLLATWHPRTRPARLQLEPAGRLNWLGLEVRRHTPIDSAHAQVEFVARFRAGGGRATRLHETSRFERGDDGRWLYVDGDIHPLLDARTLR